MAGTYRAPRPAARFLPFLVALTLAPGCDRGPRIETTSVPGRDLLMEPDAWTVAEALPGRPPRVALLAPSFTKLKWKTGGQRAALMLPPPSSVTVRILPEDGTVVLSPKCAVGYRARPPRGPNGEPVRVHFEVAVDGELVRARAIEVAKDVADEDRAWEPLGEPLELRPGDVVTLRSRLEVPDGVALERPVRAGLTGLVLERRLERVRHEATPEVPSVVLLVVDTLRADALSCLGAEPGTTPAIDALAERGLCFERAYSTSSWTWPSTASLLTGLAPLEHGVLDPKACYLSTAHRTLAELLFERGYVTGAFSCNPLVRRDKRFDQGFESFDEGDTFRFGGEVVPEILDWLDANAGSRFFLYLHLADPHLPYEPLPRFDDPRDRTEETLKTAERRILAGEGRREDGTVDLDAIVSRADREAMRRRYRAAVRTADHWIGAVLERLADLGLEDTTIVALTSDHGEELWDHGLGTHGHQLREELVHVPLILAGPGVPSGERVDAEVTNRLLAPTLAGVAGTRFDGLSDARDLLDVSRIEERPLWFSTHIGYWSPDEQPAPVYGVRDGSWVLHLAPGTNEPDRLHLFDLARDPHERHDLAAEEPARVHAMRERLLEHIRACEARRPRAVLPASEETQKMLRDLGYVDSDD